MNTPAQPSKPNPQGDDREPLPSSARGAAPSRTPGEHPKPAKDQPATDDPAMQGEGNYTAARRHRASAEKFVASGQVDAAAHDAAPDNAEEAQELRDAEEAGKAPARR
jgi:hypothetical protein